jgi:hypothetical protein
MSALLQELQRWQGSDRAANASERWTGWAQSLSERYGRIPSRHHGVAMTLAQAPEWLVVHCQRWEHAAWTLCPQINLAIGPILRQTVWPGAHVLPMTQVRSASPVPVALSRQWAPARPPSESSLVSPELRDLPRPAERQPPALAASDADWRMPLQRVFARTHVEDVHDSVTVAQVRRESLFAQQSHQILRRVSEERQRVESWQQRNIVTRHRKELTSVITEAEAREVVMQSPRGLRVGGSGMAQMTSPPAVDIERLTDEVVRHIDRRIVAHRERLGRPF